MTTSNRLLDEVQDKLNVRTDRELAKALGFAPRSIKGFRTKEVPPSSRLQLRILEATNWTLSEMREKMREGV